MSAIAAAIGAAVAGAAVSGAISYAASPGAPQYPNEAASTAQLANLNARELPTWLQEEAAAQLGIKTNIPATGSHQVSTQMVSIPVPGEGGQQSSQVPYNAADWQPGGRYYNLTDNGRLQPQITQQTSQVANTGPTPGDFTGYGTADVEAAQAQQAAEANLALQQKFAPQFIAQALSEEQQANPQGVAARAEQNKLIQDEIAHPQTDPVAEQLNSQVSQQLSAAADHAMTPQEQAQFSQNVTEALNSRGQAGPQSSGAFETPITTGASGEQRQQAAAQEGTGWLSSGQTPADFQYRQQQQAMSDLASMVNGQTPESQFRSLSGAQQGPVPNSTATMSQLPNQGNAANELGIQSTNLQMQAQQGQANPWALGVSSALNLGTAIANIR